MKLLGRSIGVLLVLPVVILIGGFIFATIYSNWFTYTHRFRLAIEVETPAGLKSASSVLQASYSETPRWVPQAAGANSSVRGDAVFLKLGDGKNVIVLLAFGEEGEVDFQADLAARALDRLPTKPPPFYVEAPSWTGTAELKGELVPTLVTFADLGKPETARVIRPNEFEAVFGSGYRLKRIWIEMTREPVVRSIEKQLPWLVGFKGYLGGSFDASRTRPSKNLSANAFIMGH